MLRLLPTIGGAVLVLPVAAGLVWAALPAFGYLPVLGGDAFSLEPFRRVFSAPGILRSVLLSLAAGLATTFCAFTIVMLFVAGWQDTRLFRVIERLVSPLLSVPHAAAAFGLVFLIAPSGFLARLVSPALTGWDRPPDLVVINDPLGLSMMAGLVAKEVPFLLLVTLAVLPQIRAHEFARLTTTLGYGRVTGFVHATLPRLYRQIRLPIFAVIAYASAVVDVALVLGPTTPAPLAVRIVQWQSDPDLSMRFVAAAGAMLQVGVTVAALGIWVGLEPVAGWLFRRLARSGARFPRDRLPRLIGAGLMALGAIAVIGGILLLGLWSVAGLWQFPDAVPRTFTLSNWMRAAPGLAGPTVNAVSIALVSCVLAVVLALGALEYEARAGKTPTIRAMILLYLPLLVPQIAFLFGLEVVLARLQWSGAFAAVALAHLVFVFPYVLLSLSDPWRNWDYRYAHMARALGHGANIVFWRVRLPMMLRPVLTAAAVGFAVSLGLYLPTLLIGGGRWPTVTTEAVALAAGGNRRIIGVTALIQALLPFAGFAVALLLPAFLYRNRRAMRAA